jgi:hypothetical protein
MSLIPDFIFVDVPARGYAPKGRKKTAQGFNPGYDVIKRRALKGHQNLRGTFNSWRAGPKAYTLGRHFQGASFWDYLPRVKPWAVLLRPFGAEDSLSDGADSILRRLRRLLRRSRKDDTRGATRHP